MSDYLSALEAAIAALPDDIELRVRYGRHLIAAGRHAEAIAQGSHALGIDAGNADAAALIRDAAASIAGATAVPESAHPESAEAEPASPLEPDVSNVDWSKFEEQLKSPFAPPFVQAGERDGEVVPVTENVVTDPAMEVTRETITLADVGGLDQVKRRINESFLEPMRNPEIAKAFGKSLRGGLILYGPPGCGKTFIARAIAGELKASFISVTISDILDRYMGESEANMAAVFDRARALAPAVLFFDEVDVVGGKRSKMGNFAGMRNVVNQMLMEMDGVGSDNDGLFVLAATNHPWDVDSALLRPGRFDRMVLVLPPDEPARAAILRLHLSGRPIEGIDLDELVNRTDGFSGADLQHVCATAGEKAMMASIQAGEVRPINMSDVREALKEIKPSIGAWLQSAKNVVEYGNQSGQYDDLADYLKLRKII